MEKQRKGHVVHVGFYEEDLHVVDFENYNVTTLVHRHHAEELSRATRRQFARIGELDVPHDRDQDGYDRASDQMIALVTEFSKDLGPPCAVVGMFENTTVPAARLREHFGAQGTDLQTAERCRDKVTMKEALAGSGVRTPRFWRVGAATTEAELREIAGGLPGKVVLKPRSQAACFGVEIFPNAAAFLEHCGTVGLQDDYEVEEFVEGTACHFDGVVRGGALRFLCASRFWSSSFDFQRLHVPLVSVTFDDPATVARIADFTELTLKTLGLRDSTFHLEAFLTDDDQLVFLELGSRFGGAYISDHIKAAYGVDLVDESVRACMNQPSALASFTTHLDHPDVGASGWVYTPLSETARCRVRRIHGLDACPDSVILSSVPDIAQTLNDDIGMFVASGRFALAGPTAAAVERDMSTIVESYSVDVELA
jgi:biotin carboxylase